MVFGIDKKKRESGVQSGTQSGHINIQPQNLISSIVLMKQQGYDDNQIVQTLQSQGFNQFQILEAINQTAMPTSQTNPPANDADQQEYEPYQQSYPQGFQYGTPSYEQPVQGKVDDERIQEIAEAIIEERWQSLIGDITKVISWKEKSEERISRIEQQIIDIKLSIDSLTKSIIGKISAYDQNIVDVGVEIKAMEKVFQKILPNLTENVNKLDRMTKSFEIKDKK